MHLCRLSCGIAYAFRYIRAMEGGVEMGILSRCCKEVIIQPSGSYIGLFEGMIPIPK